ARREGLDPGVRDSFAAAGIAHLLAISGFHVGVLALWVLILIRTLRLPPRWSTGVVVGVVWGYVLMIGAPAAARRAALILTAVLVTRTRGRPSSRWAPLSVAALAVLLSDSDGLSSPGVQLSFAGAAGLLRWAGPWSAVLQSWGQRRTPRLPRSVWSAVAGALAATVATAPIVGWHFERVSSVGVPVTLLATPLVSAAMPGGIAALLLERHAPSVAGVIAAGTSTLLDALVTLTETAAKPWWATLWVSRFDLAAAGVGTVVAYSAARSPGVGAVGRRARIVLWVGVAIALAPVVRGIGATGSLELRVLDVGQGDALALRTPRGRWILVDAGRPGDGPTANHPVVQSLRQAGVGEIALFVISHADADHFGGGEAVLAHHRVRRILDPAVPVGKGGYVRLLQAARAEGVSWEAGRAGDRLEVDGVHLTVVAPADTTVHASSVPLGSTVQIDANASSLVVLVEWGAFRALLTGDALAATERSIAATVGDIDVLKVAHHGSLTSSDPAFLAAVRPEWALISAGRRNRYGHPSPEVLGRLETVGADILRTDRDGEIRLRVDRNGEVRVWTARK
ncbi:MAG: DNA internalization-related competence protein ComEC/Rec2, partial [Gemmatimonadota bacterium]